MKNGFSVMRAALVASVALVGVVGVPNQPATAVGERMVWGETTSANVGDTSSQAPNPDPNPALKQTVRDDEKLATDRVTIDAGHVDIGPRVDGGKVELVARDDTAAPPVWRHLDDVVFKVVDAGGKITMPDDPQYSFIPAKAGEDVWLIPQVEQSGVVWLGWNTQNPSFVNGATGTVTLSMTGVQGPGDVVVYVQNGGFGAPQIIWSAEHRDTSVDLNTHTHANWVFTKPGEYLIQLAMSATGKDGAPITDTRVVRLAVGDSADVNRAATMEYAGGGAGAGQGGSAGSAGSGSSNAEAASTSPSSPLPLIAGGVGALVVVLVVTVAVTQARAKRRAKREAGEE